MRPKKTNCFEHWRGPLVLGERPFSKRSPRAIRCSNGSGRRAALCIKSETKRFETNHPPNAKPGAKPTRLSGSTVAGFVARVVMRRPDFVAGCTAPFATGWAAPVLRPGREVGPARGKACGTSTGRLLGGYCVRKRRMASDTSWRLSSSENGPPRGDSRVRLAARTARARTRHSASDPRRSASNANVSARIASA